LATIARICTSTTLAKSSYYGQYLLVKETMAVQHVILTKRETRMSLGREIARAEYEKMWKDEKTQEKKNGT